MPTFSGRIRDRRVSIGGRYEVSDLGVVYSDGMPLAAIGGVGVNLGGKRVKICELVARAFLEKEEGKCWVRHRNGDVRDNRACNLEWSDEREEPRGRRSTERVVRALRFDGEVVGQWRSVREASDASGVKAEGIRACLRGARRSSGGLLWMEL